MLLYVCQILRGRSICPCCCMALGAVHSCGKPRDLPPCLPPALLQNPSINVYDIRKDCEGALCYKQFEVGGVRQQACSSFTVLQPDAQSAFRRAAGRRDAAACVPLAGTFDSMRASPLQQLALWLLSRCR